ncbi:LPS assembly lipoprotein LptE [Candidatus Deferrimicrobium sp.]|uniref:LPS assembly lipoprotein LptE n=1 Tax=Candidatus Deferrimicrobium sp. TaxID=3060586 RepID=UPI003C52F284
MAGRIAHRILIALALLSAVAGCGYRLESGTARFTDPSVRMDVSPFANRSTTPDAGAVVAARFREELRRSGFRGTFGTIGANYLVEGTIREVRSDTFSHGSDRFALENRLTLVVDVRVVEVVRGGVLWKESGLSETASYFSGTDVQYTEANRRAAFEQVVRRMAVRLSQTLRVLL